MYLCPLSILYLCPLSILYLCPLSVLYFSKRRHICVQGMMLSILVSEAHTPHTVGPHVIASCCVLSDSLHYIYMCGCVCTWLCMYLVVYVRVCRTNKCVCNVSITSQRAVHSSTMAKEDVHHYILGHLVRCYALATSDTNTWFTHC